MADSGRIEGERVMCHACQRQWQRSQGGLTCPHCESDFTEILENSPSPQHQASEPPSDRPLSPFRHLPHPFLHNHNPWPDASDPEEDDISTYQFNTSTGGRGSITFSTRTFTTRGNGRNVMLDPDMEDLAHNFVELLTNVAGPQNSRRGFNDGPMMTPLFPFGGLDAPRQPAGFDGFATGTMYPQDPHNPQAFPQPGNINDIFSLVFNHINGGAPGGPQHPGAGQPGNPFAILSQLFNPANARHGDAVFSQEAFDRVMSQLMDQNAGSTAPGPASEAAIRSLPTKPVEKEMMGDDGKAECSICMDNVELRENVTFLPCNHWFHGQCVKAWLEEHDTCPHCRKPITSPEEPNQPNPPPGSRRRSSRRSSSVASPMSPAEEGSRRNPFTIPESPAELQEARPQFYGHRMAENYDRPDRPRSHRHTSSQNEAHVASRHGSRSGGSSSSNGGNGGNGGVSGWIRNHLPFQG